MDLDDLLSEPVAVNSRARVKFQPKARPKSNVKVTIVSASGRCGSIEDKTVITDPKRADTSFVSCLDPPIEIASVNRILSSVDALSGMPCSSTHVDSSSQLQHPLISMEASQQEGSVFAGGKIAGPSDVSTRLAISKGDIASTDFKFPGNTSTFDIHGDKQAGSERSRETAGIFSELESLDALSQSAISNVSTMRKFQPKTIINVQPRNKLPGSRPISEADPSISHGEIPSHQGTILEQGLASAASAPNVSASPFDYTSEATPNRGNVQSGRPTNEYLDDDLTSYPQDGFTDFSTMGFSNSVPRDTLLELHATEENHAEVSLPNSVTHKDFVVSQAGHVISGKEDDRSILAGSKEIEIDQSSKQLVPLVAADETTEESQEKNDLLSGPSQDLNNTRQTLKKMSPELEKTGRGHKKASEGSETLDKEPPKKKFSHSTRRNKRRVDKVLLETPEDEINPRKLILRDLILLAEAKERLLVSNPNAANNSSPYQSTTYTEDSPFEEDAPFAYEADQAEHFVEPKLNYHTYMNKTSKERWSKQDTDLFYEGIQQFGTDFALIQQLFPGRTRHQVKSKYKKEEREQPMRLSDALTNRSTNHSHFELVIERLQKAAADAKTEHDSDRDDESIGVTGEEEITRNMNEEVSKKHDDNEEEEVDEAMMEAEVATMNHQGCRHSPAESHQESEEDVYDIWSEYKSDI